MGVDKDTQQPLYRQVYDTIMGRIVSGDLQPGSMLPSEFDIASELSVSQGTARKALMELEQKGVLERRQGKGTFVSVSTNESALFHFFRLRYPDGTQAKPHLERETIKRRKSLSKERRFLDDDAEAVFEIERLRSIDGMIVTHERCIVPAKLFPGLADRTPLPNALYPFYQRAYGLAIDGATEQLRAVVAEKDEATAFGIKLYSPLLEVTRQAWDLSGRIVELRVSRYLTDNLRYDVSLR